MLTLEWVDLKNVLRCATLRPGDDFGWRNIYKGVSWNDVLNTLSVISEDKLKKKTRSGMRAGIRCLSLGHVVSIIQKTTSHETLVDATGRINAMKREV